MQATQPSAPAPQAPSPEVEAARYALLRRLAPSMRHHLVVNLQPIGMIYEVMERRLRAPAPGLAQLQDSASKINGFARAALNSCNEVVGWLAPDETVRVPVAECVHECAALLATSLGFRGYALRNEVEELPGELRRSAIRSMLTSAMLHATDHAAPPCELVLSARAEPGGVQLQVSLRPGQGDKGFPAEPNYRKLEWADLQALARAEGAQLQRDGDLIGIRLPWAAGPAS